MVREDTTTTKVRVVFDAAAKCHGYSINDFMHAGPNLMNNVQVILLFCHELIAIAGDISEMFLQVQLSLEDQKYHAFLWKSPASDSIQEFEFLRFVFGIKASPYLAGRGLKQEAEQCDSEVL